MSDQPWADEGLLRALVPQVLTALMRRGADFATAEDAVAAVLEGTALPVR